MSQHTEKLAVMFADICDSTGLYERLGDKAPRARLVEQCLAMMIDKMKSNQGILIETKTLRYRDKSCQIKEHHKSAVLGRDESCDIEVNHGFTSRRHVRIELRSGQFVIADQSTNGTFIRFSDGHSVRLGREELVLHGCGSINLGQSYEDNPLDIVEFLITTASA